LAGCVSETSSAQDKLAMKWPPGKETGPVVAEPKTDAARGYPRCEHNATRLELLPQGSVHHAKEVCTNCDAILRFVAKPRTIVRRRLNAFRLVKLALCERLSPWELAFIHNVSRARKLSPRQQAYLDAACDALPLSR
jgi:hypothetical protein